MLPWLVPPPMPATAPVAVGEYVVQPRERKLLDTRGQAVPIGGRAFELLLALIGRAGQVVSLDELKQLAWPGIVIEPNTLRVHMASLRKALRDNQKEARYIATVPGRGYSLICSAGALNPKPRKPLPSNHDAVIGRDAEVDALVRGTQRHRVTTVVAGGGMGKSTLAREVAQAAGLAFGDEVHFIDLAACSDAQAQAAITEHVELAGAIDRKSLLILDNCEQVLDVVATSVLQLTAQSSPVHVLATSREPMGLPHEQLHWLRPLEVPGIESIGDGGEQVITGSAVKLLIDRVRARDGGRFQWSADNTLDAIALCRRAQGLPLAIELLAASVAQMGLRATVGLSDEDLLALPHPRRTVPERHASLDALCRSSHERLDQAERAMLRCCSRFDGAFTFEDARQRMAAAESESPLMPGRLLGLLQKSLIEPAPEAGPGHFRVPALLRLHLGDRDLRPGQA